MAIRIVDTSSHYLGWTALDLTGAWTIAMKVKTETTLGWVRLLCQYNSDTTSWWYGLATQITNAGVINATVGYNASRYYITGTTRIDDGEWHDVVLTYNPSVGFLLYIDGSPESTTSGGSLGSNVLNPPGIPLEYGRLYQASTYYYSGISTIDRILYCNQVLTPEQVAGLSNGTPWDDAPGMQSLWMLEGEPGTTASGAGTLADDGAANNDGTPYNNPLYATPANTPPTCGLTVDSVVGRTVTVTVTGQDAEGDLASGSITWGDEETTDFSAGELATLDGGGSVQKRRQYAAAGGTFGLYAALYDEAGEHTDSTLAEAVVSPNTGPTASFTVEVDPSDNLTVTVNANSSEDPDGQIVAWRMIPGNGAGWIDGVVGEALVYEYPTHGEFTMRVEVTDNDGATDEQSALVNVENDPPEAAGNVAGGWRHVTLTDESTDPDGTIVSGSVDWGDGSDPEAITPGGSLDHSYENTTDDYSITLTVTDDDGDSDDVEIPVSITAWEPDFTFEKILLLRNVEVDASTLDPPAGETITDYAWDWGDESTAGSGATATHHYADAGVYTITLSVTLSDGETYETTKEIRMATITKVSTPLGPLAEPAVTVITITGTSLPLTGEVKIGGEVAEVQVSPARSATTITVKAHADTPLGPQDVEVYDAETPAVRQAIAVMGIMIYDPTDNRDGAEVPFQMMDQVWIDGLCFGYAGDGMTLTPSFQAFDYVPPNAFLPANKKTFLTGMEATIKFDQVDGSLLAEVLGGTYDATTKVLTLAGDAELAEHSIVAKDTNGNLLFIRAAKISGGGALNFNKNFGSVETTWQLIKKTDCNLLEKYDAA